MKIELEIEDPENAKFIGQKMVDQARHLEMWPEHKNSQVTEEMYTVGRQLIEESRDAEKSLETEDCLYWNE
jgi:hypothetical protein